MDGWAPSRSSFAEGMVGSSRRSRSSLQRRWRRVASTHNLEDLLRDTDSQPAVDRRDLLLVGGSLLVLSSGLFLFVALSVVAKFVGLPEGENVPKLLQWMHDDWFYCFLVPLTIPASIFAAIVSWFSLKFFKHNS